MEQSIYWAEALSNEDLIAALTANPNDGLVFEELTRRLRPVILGEALKYRQQLPYDTDDYLQEGRIVLWKIAARGSFKTGSFRNYFISAMRFHLCHVYRDYVLKTPCASAVTRTSGDRPTKSSLKRRSSSGITPGTASTAAEPTRRRRPQRRLNALAWASPSPSQSRASALRRSGKGAVRGRSPTTTPTGMK